MAEYIYEKRRFFNQMADGWTSANYAIDDKMHRYICEIKKRLTGSERAMGTEHEEVTK
jgi:hypothetical protein